jgi:hypothetical protein
MRIAALLLLTAAIAGAQNIATKVLSSGVPIHIALSTALTTTLLFPGPLSGTFGLGLITGNSNTGGSVQVEHPDGSDVLVLHALSESARVIMTVLLDGQLYVFALEGSQTPDVAITLVRQGSSQDPTGAPRAVEVTPEQIQADRIHYDPELLLGLLRRARDNEILRPIYKNLYAGYSKREAQYTSDSGTVKTTITTIHRFSKEDAIVLQGVVENETDKPLTFDGRAATVQVANEFHPIKLLDCLRPIPPHTKTLIDVVIQGDVDGGRANLAINNEFRIMLPGNTGIWSLKNGGSGPGGRFTVPEPLKPSPIPLTQTGSVKREAQ